MNMVQRGRVQYNISNNQNNTLTEKKYPVILAGHLFYISSESWRDSCPLFNKRKCFKHNFSFCERIFMIRGSLW